MPRRMNARTPRTEDLPFELFALPTALSRTRPPADLVIDPGAIFGTPASATLQTGEPEPDKYRMYYIGGGVALAALLVGGALYLGTRKGRR